MRGTAGVAAVAAGLMLTGCSIGGGSEEPATSASQDEGGGSASATGSEDEGGENSSEELDTQAGEAGVDPTEPPEPIATVEAPATDSTGEPTTLTVDLLEARREDELLVLTVRFTPAEGDGKPQWLYHYLGQETWAPQVIDTTNLRVHNVVKGEGQPKPLLTDYQGTKFGPGQRYYAFAVFAAPPEDVESVTVNVVGGAESLTEVPLS